MYKRQGHANAADIQARGQLVTHKVAGAQAAALIVLNDLVERVTDTLGNTCLLYTSDLFPAHQIDPAWGSP